MDLAQIQEDYLRLSRRINFLSEIMWGREDELIKKLKEKAEIIRKKLDEKTKK